MRPPVVEVEGLEIALARSQRAIVTDVSFAIGAGEVLGLVGETGSGKTTVGLALLGFCRSGAIRTAGRVRIDGEDLFDVSASRLQDLRGATVAYVPQDPASALNPALAVGTQVAEVLTRHSPDLSAAERRERILTTLAETALPTSSEFLGRYPHQLSGGQQQRLCLAMALVCRPAVVVLDEPTTGLDVTTQARILETVSNLCRTHQLAALYVSHDLAVIAQVSDRVAVLYAGRLAEIGPRDAVFWSPAHPYTAGLLHAIPRLLTRQDLRGIPGRGRAHRPPERGCPFAPRCDLAIDICREQFPRSVRLAADHEAWCWRSSEVLSREPVLTRTLTDEGKSRPCDVVLRVDGLRASYGRTEVLHGVDLEVQAGSTLAVVGESGSGKTTLAWSIAGLHRPDSGTVTCFGTALPAQAVQRTREQLRQIQFIFQSPYSSLNPRKTIQEILDAPIRLLKPERSSDIRSIIGAALEQVGLGLQMLGRYPKQLSGGERQRVAIARALVAQPSILICDEITSALDVSVQASIVQLLQRLQTDAGLTIMFVTHNLALVRNIADEVVVLNKGVVEERGRQSDIFENPETEYTRRLLHDTPTTELVDKVGAAPHPAPAAASNDWRATNST